MKRSHLCPDCGLVLLYPEKGCPRCAAAPERQSSRPTDWVPLFNCPDQLTALTLQAELKGHGIRSWIRSLEVPGYDGLMGMGPPFWGWLLVDRDDLVWSREIVREFLSSLESSTGDLGGKA